MGIKVNGLGFVLVWRQMGFCSGALSLAAQPPTTSTIAYLSTTAISFFPFFHVFLVPSWVDHGVFLIFTLGLPNLRSPGSP